MVSYPGNAPRLVKLYYPIPWIVEYVIRVWTFFFSFFVSFSFLLCAMEQNSSLAVLSIAPFSPPHLLHLGVHLSCPNFVSWIPCLPS